MCLDFGGDPKLDDEFDLIIVVLEIEIIEMLPHVRPFNVMASGKNAIACPLEMSLKLPPI